MRSKYIIFGLIIFVLLFFFTQNKEHAGSGSTPPPSSTTPSTTPILSNEAIQNVARVYADANNTAVFNNVNITGKLNIIPTGTIVAFNSATAPAGCVL
jgi:hypothetical protein